MRDDRPAYGLFLLTANAIVSEVCATLPFDWLILDLEASPAERVDILHFLQALSRSQIAPLVRVRSQEHSHIEQVLDLGVAGIVVPKVETRAEAEAVVRAVRYPPLGKRGVNPVRASGYFSDVPGYLATANERTLCLVQIESRRAAENLEEILSVPGYDGVFVGCGDLAMSLGHPANVRHADVEQAIERIAEGCRTHGKIAGIFAYALDLAARYRELGYTVIALGNDIAALRSCLADWLSAVRTEFTVELPRR